MKQLEKMIVTLIREHRIKLDLVTEKAAKGSGQFTNKETQEILSELEVLRLNLGNLKECQSRLARHLTTYKE